LEKGDGAVKVLLVWNRDCNYLKRNRNVKTSSDERIEEKIPNEYCFTFYPASLRLYQGSDGGISGPEIAIPAWAASFDQAFSPLSARVHPILPDRCQPEAAVWSGIVI
jgi:hypothetical protein